MSAQPYKMLVIIQWGKEVPLGLLRLQYLPYVLTCENTDVAKTNKSNVSYRRIHMDHSKENLSSMIWTGYCKGMIAHIINTLWCA